MHKFSSHSAARHQALRLSVFGIAAGAAVLCTTTLNNGQSLFSPGAPQVVHAAVLNSQYGKGPALDDSAATKVWFEAKINSDWNLMDRPSFGGITKAYYHDLGTNFKSATIVVHKQKQLMPNATFDLVTLPNGKSYWVDDKSLTSTSKRYQNGPAIDVPGAKKVSYTATIASNWQLEAKPLTSDSSLTYFSNILGEDLANQSVQVYEEYSTVNATACLVRLKNGQYYWVDKQAFSAMTFGKYQPYDKNKAHQEYTPGVDGSRIYSIKHTATPFPLYDADGIYGSGDAASDTTKLGGTYVIAAGTESVTSLGGTQKTIVKVSPDNKHWYWIDQDALSLGAPFDDGTTGGTAFAGLIGTGTNGAIKYYLSPSDKLTKAIQAAIDKWNKAIPGLFEQANNSSDVDIQFVQKRVADETWAHTDHGYYFDANHFEKSNQSVEVQLSNTGKNNLVANVGKGPSEFNGSVSIIAHELGHALGLGHSGDTNAAYSFAGKNDLMYAGTDGTDGTDKYYTDMTHSIQAVKLIRQLGWTIVAHH